MICIDRGEAPERTAADDTFLVNLLAGVGVNGIKIDEAIRNRIEVIGEGNCLGLRVPIYVAEGATGRAEGIIGLVMFAGFGIGIAGTEAMVARFIPGL